MRTCCYCGSHERELRPYGPGGADLCFPCMKATPGREEQAKSAYGALLEGAEAASALGGGAVVGQSVGPQPLDVLPLELLERIAAELEES